MENLRGAFTFGLGAMPSLTMPEEAGEAFVTGALLVLDAGQVEESQGSPTNETVVGVAEEPASGTENDPVRFTPALRHVVFEGTLRNAAGDYALAAGDLGARYGIGAIGTVGAIYYVDQEETGDTRVAIVGFRDPVGTVSARVYFVFLPLATIYGAAAG